jgi:putative (di)nucleoside polyphosphate hydrolase
MKDLPYRPGVGIMLLSPEGKIFTARRLDMRSEAWQMPQGGIDEGEDPEAAMWRELYEETGVKRAALLARSRDWLHYDLPEALVPLFWGGRFRGQRQLWYCLRHEGGDDEINIHTDHPEFSEWRWAEPPALCDLIVPFKRALYAKILEEFTPFLGR